MSIEDRMSRELDWQDGMNAFRAQIKTRLAEIEGEMQNLKNQVFMLEALMKTYNEMEGEK